MVRCKSCYNYGHTSPFCLSKMRKQQRFRVVSRLEAKGPVAGGLNTGATLKPSVLPSSIAIPPPPPPDLSTEPPPSTMANWSVDPSLWFQKDSPCCQWKILSSAMRST
jgi:hypothetical protein